MVPATISEAEAEPLLTKTASCMEEGGYDKGGKDGGKGGKAGTTGG